MTGKADPFDFSEGSASSQRPRRKSGMSNRNIIVLVSVGVVVVFCVLPGFVGIVYFVGYLNHKFENPNVNQANYDRIHLGMRLKEVEAIMGGKGSQITARDGTMYEWRNGDASITVSVPDRTPGPDSRIIRMDGGGWQH